MGWIGPGLSRPELDFSEHPAEPFLEPMHQGVRLLLERVAAGDRQFHLRTSRGPAKNVKASANPIRPLPHSGKSPVAIAPSLQNVGLDTAAVIAYQQPKLVGAIPHFDIDARGARVAERIRQRFASNPEQFVAKKRM